MALMLEVTVIVCLTAATMMTQPANDGSRPPKGPSFPRLNVLEPRHRVIGHFMCPTASERTGHSQVRYTQAVITSLTPYLLLFVHT